MQIHTNLVATTTYADSYKFGCDYNLCRFIQMLDSQYLRVLRKKKRRNWTFNCTKKVLFLQGCVLTFQTLGILHQNFFRTLNGV